MRLSITDIILYAVHARMTQNSFHRMYNVLNKFQLISKYSCCNTYSHAVHYIIVYTFVLFSSSISCHYNYQNITMIVCLTIMMCVFAFALIGIVVVSVLREHSCGLEWLVCVFSGLKWSIDSPAHIHHADPTSITMYKNTGNHSQGSSPTRKMTCTCTISGASVCRLRVSDWYT